jgi:formate hydrogenlyase transcriptional activator
MNETADPALEQYLTLLDVPTAIASHRNLSDLFQDLTARLRRLLDFHYLSVVLYDAAQHVMRLHNLESSICGTLQPGVVFAVEDIPSGWVWQHLRELSVRSFCCLPLTTAHRRLGAWAIGRAMCGSCRTLSSAPSF